MFGKKKNDESVDAQQVEDKKCLSIVYKLHMLRYDRALTDLGMSTASGNLIAITTPLTISHLQKPLLR